MLEAGQHLLIEKPLAPSRAETRTLLELARDRKRVVRPVHQLAFQRWLPKLELIGEFLDLAYDTCSAGAAGTNARTSDAVVDEILSHPLSLFDRILPGALALAQFDCMRPRPGQLRAQAAVEGVGLSISISMDGRATRHELRVTGTKGTLVADLFHGFAWIDSGGASRSAKIARPLLASARWGAAATANLAGRSLRREPAYPGLRELVAAFYAEVRAGEASNDGDLPFGSTLHVAQIRDEIIAASKPS